MAGISYQGKTILFLYENNIISANNIEILKEALDEIRFRLNSDKVLLQMNNAIFLWTTKALEFYSKNRIKLIYWPPYSPDLNPTENIWAIMRVRERKKIRRKEIAKIYQFKNQMYDIWKNADEDMVEILNKHLQQNRSMY